VETIHQRCAGIDVHKKTVVVCRILPREGGTWIKETKTFGTFSDELLNLLDWLKAGEVTHVAMESTGVYWKPIYNILEAELEVLLVNARHIKFVPGRKTDVKDAQWIAELLQHGLLKASYIPAIEQRDLRDLVRLPPR
jgi:transposase